MLYAKFRALIKFNIIDKTTTLYDTTTVYSNTFILFLFLYGIPLVYSFIL